MNLKNKLLNWLKSKKELLAEIEDLRSGYIQLVQKYDNDLHWSNYYDKRRRELEEYIAIMKNDPTSIFKEYEDKMSEERGIYNDLSNRYFKLQEEFWALQDSKSTANERKLLEAMLTITEVLNDSKTNRN